MNNNKIKIVHIAQANGGVEIYLKMFFKYANNNKYDNYLILSEQYNKSKKYFENLGATVFIVKMNREVSLSKDLKAMFSIYKILRTIKPNIVYTHSSKAGGLGRIPAKLVRARNIYNPHGWAFDMNISNKKKTLFKFIEKVLGSFTEQVIAISDYEKCVAVDNNIIDDSKITIIENAIDLEKAKEEYDNTRILREINFNKDNIIIGMIARISEQKSPHTFVDIAIKLSNKYPKCRFLMVGDGDQRVEIEERIKSSNLESRFYITGWVDNPYEYLSIFDIALLTSKWEGFGLVIPEYMLAKKPIIASNVGGISNIIEDSKNGYLIDNLDVDKFVEKIESLIKDPKNKNVLIENAYTTVISKYDFRRVIKEHEFVFNNE